MALSVTEIVVMSRLLDDALPLDKAGRRRWLEQLATEHRELAPALGQALFPQDDTRSGSILLDTLPKMGAGSGAQAVSGSGLKPSERVGPYQLVRLLGAGGMAEVWLAQRADGAFKREVALKVVAASNIGSHRARLRFDREVQIFLNMKNAAGA